MRRWIVERKLVPVPAERVSSLLAHRMTWERTALPGAGPETWLDLRVQVEPGPEASAWLVVVGAYPVAHPLVGHALHVGPLREGARALARQVLAELAEEVTTVLAPLPGIEPFGTLRPDPAALLVRHVLDEDAPVIDEAMEAAAAGSLLAAQGADGAPVVDDYGRLIGVLSERDLLCRLVQELDPIPNADDAQEACALCTRPPIITAPGLSALRAAQQMLFHGVRRLIVVEKGHLVGVVTRKSLFAALRASAPGAAADAAASERKTDAPDALRITHGAAPVS